jgi:hypothetical protein
VLVALALLFQPLYGQIIEKVTQCPAKIKKALYLAKIPASIQGATEDIS